MAKIQLITQPIKGFLSGFRMYEVSSTVLGVFAGKCVDSTGQYFIEVPTRQKTTGAYTYGNNLGGMDTGTFPASPNMIYVYAIRNLVNGQTDIIFSLNDTTPTLPVGTWVYRRVGMQYTSSSVFRSFIQRGDTIHWYAGLDVSFSDIDTTDSDRVMGSNLFTSVNLATEVYGTAALNTDANSQNQCVNIGVAGGSGLVSPVAAQLSGSANGQYAYRSYAAASAVAGDFGAAFHSAQSAFRIIVFNNRIRMRSNVSSPQVILHLQGYRDLMLAEGL